MRVTTTCALGRNQVCLPGGLYSKGVSDGWAGVNDEYFMPCCSRGCYLFWRYIVGKECLFAIIGLDSFGESKSPLEVALLARVSLQ